MQLVGYFNVKMKILNAACFLHRFPDHLYCTEGLHSPENPMTAIVFRETIKLHVVYTTAKNQTQFGPNIHKICISDMGHKTIFLVNRLRHVALHN